MDIRIGITTSLENGELRLRRQYVDAVARSGALPLIVPLVDDEEAVHALADVVDGLIVPGGPAVTDGLVGALPDDLQEPDPLRTRFDQRLLNAVLERRKPVLGICYGMQLLNALAGGRIYADVERQLPGAAVHSEKRGADTHALEIEPDTHLAAILGRTRCTVNTRHIQAVAEVGAPYRVSARAPDGAIEAIESEDGLVLGVQFHPERMGEAMSPLFAHLVAKAQRWAGEHSRRVQQPVNK